MQNTSMSSTWLSNPYISTPKEEPGKSLLSPFINLLLNFLSLKLLGLKPYLYTCNTNHDRFCAIIVYIMHSFSILWVPTVCQTQNNLFREWNNFIPHPYLCKRRKWGQKIRVLHRNVWKYFWKLQRPFKKKKIINYNKKPVSPLCRDVSQCVWPSKGSFAFIL